MAATDTLVLVRRAKDGDRKAWADLLERYYDRWIRKYQGNLGPTVRKLYDTQDLVQSAVGDALRDISSLKSEAAFFAWVSAIIRHKLAMRRRELERESSLEGSAAKEVAERPDEHQPGPEPAVATLESYVHCLGVILELFPRHPEPMAAVIMKILDGHSIQVVAERLGRPERTAYRLLQKGTDLLKARLKS